jgi:uncharacterized protein YggU (UPF0235/DUF167 family)
MIIFSMCRNQDTPMFLKVKVLPNEKEEEIIKKAEDRFEIKVKEKPENGLANQRVIKLLSSYFNLPKNKIRLIKGAKEKKQNF